MKIQQLTTCALTALFVTVGAFNAFAGDPPKQKSFNDIKVFFENVNSYGGFSVVLEDGSKIEIESGLFGNKEDKEKFLKNLLTQFRKGKINEKAYLTLSKSDEGKQKKIFTIFMQALVLDDGSSDVDHKNGNEEESGKLTPEELELLRLHGIKTRIIDFHQVSTSANMSKINLRKKQVCKIPKFFRYCPNLTYVDFSVDNNNGYHDGLPLINDVSGLKDCKNLKRVDFRLSAVSITNVLTSLNSDKIEEINLVFCRNLFENKEKEDNVNGLKLLKKFKVLKKIDFSGTGIKSENTKCLKESDNCEEKHNLEQLILSGCYELDEKGATDLLSCFKRIQLLDIGYNKHITISSLEPLLKHLPFLKILLAPHMADHEQISNPEFYDLTTLEILDLRWNYDAKIKNIPNSVKIFCMSFMRTTDIKFLKHHPNLEILILRLPGVYEDANLPVDDDETQNNLKNIASSLDTLQKLKCINNKSLLSDLSLQNNITFTNNDEPSEQDIKKCLGKKENKKLILNQQLDKEAFQEFIQEQTKKMKEIEVKIEKNQEKIEKNENNEKPN